VYKKLRKEFSLELLAVFFGLSAFSIHTLMDLDWQVAGLMFWYAILAFAGSYEEDFPQEAHDKASKYSLNSLIVLTALLTIAGGVHWSISDSRHYELLDVAGQQPGVPQQPQSSFTVDKKVQAALSVAPYSHSIYMVWGNDALRRGDLDNAEKRYNQALQMVPRSSGVYERLGDVYKQRGDMTQAAIYYDKADKLFPYKKIFFEKRKNGDGKNE
jgi:tetratricopeptide (TPR) repeat protein